MILMSGASSRALSVITMFSASSSTQATIPRARSMPAERNSSSSLARPSRKRTPDGLGALAVLRVGVDDDVLGPGRAQVAGHLAAHAAEAADDVVVGQRVDHPARPSVLQQPREVSGDEELGDGDEGVQQRTHAEHDQDHLDDLPAHVGRGLDRAHGGDDVEGPDEAVPHVGALAQREPDGAEDQQPGDQREEEPDAAREVAELQLGPSVVVGLAGQDLVRPVELLEQHHRAS